MRRRLYFMLPTMPSARTMLDELLLARVEERHLRFMAHEGTLLPDMPDASFLQKTDLVHGAQMGMIIGALVGLGVGVLLVLFPPEGITVRMIAILVAALAGALFGGWASGMNAAAIPNSRLAAFAERIAQGQVLLIVDLPFQRVQEIENMIKRKHPDIDFGGVDPHIPAFP